MASLSRAKKTKKDIMAAQKNRCQKIIQAVFIPVLDLGNGNEASIRCF